MKNKNNEIVFYGQDYSAVDESYFVDSQNRLDKLKNDDNKRELLTKALKKINKLLKDQSVSDTIVVGQTERPDDDKNIDRKLKRELEICDFDAEGIPQKYGSLVGTVCVSVKEDRKKKDTRVKIVIFSRFDDINKTDPESTSPYFLASMLLKGKLKFHNRQVNFSYDNLFDFYMLWILKKHFIEAKQKGFFKKYQRFERNDDRVRGAIDISKHIRLNMGLNNGKIAYSYRENSVDNPINHLILTAFDYLKEKYPEMVDHNMDYEIEQMLKELKYEISYPKYSRRSVVSLNQMPIAHPFFTEYEELRKDCLKIMRDEGVSPFQSETENVDGLLYYVPDLWEEYLQDAFEKMCRNYNNGNKISVEEELPNQFRLSVKAQEKIFIMSDWDNNKNENNTSYPDFVFSYDDLENDNYGKEGEQVRVCIFDAKYKPAWKNGLKGILESRLREDYDKCIRDMESVDGMAAGVVFPMKIADSRDDDNYIHRFSKYNSIKRFYTIPVIIPDMSEDNKTLRFVEWEKALQQNIEDFADKMQEVLVFETQMHMDYSKALKKLKGKYIKI